MGESDTEDQSGSWRNQHAPGQHQPSQGSFAPFRLRFFFFFGCCPTERFQNRASKERAALPFAGIVNGCGSVVVIGRSVSLITKRRQERKIASTNGKRVSSVAVIFPNRIHQWTRLGQGTPTFIERNMAASVCAAGAAMMKKMVRHYHKHGA